MLLAIILLFAGAVQGDASQQATPKASGAPAPVQKPAIPPATPKTSQNQSEPNQSEKAQSGKAKVALPADKTNPKKVRPWRVRIMDSFGAPFISVHAKKAVRSEVSAEIARLLKIPVILGTNMKQEQLTTDFDDLPLDAAVKLLAPRPVVDYIISGGGDSTRPAKKRAIAVYLLAGDDKAPQDAPWRENKAAGQLVVGMVYETEEEEKAALEKKKNELQVTYNDGLFTVRVYKQFLLDVLQEVADQARIPFAIITTNGGQKEIDQVVTWNMSGVDFQELTNTWFPNGVRLYWRTDLASDISKPLRLTIEDREEDAQAVQNVTP
jgi:hypothetical protein